MTYRFSKRSIDNLEGVHPDLIRVAHEAIRLTGQDFTIIAGMRTLDEQRKLVASGASKTMNSRHLTGHALDCAPYVASRGGIVWSPDDLFTDIAEGFRKASLTTGIPIRWGRAWHGYLADFPSAEDALNSYVKLRRSQGRRPFLDGPHFELPSGEYP